MIFCTFVGYVVGGPWGALTITAGVFLSAFAFSTIFYERLERIMDMPRLQTPLVGVAAAVVGIIGATTIQLGLVTAERVPSLAWAVPIAGLALVISYRWKNKLNVAVVLAVSGVAGWLVFR